jgi:glycosyltransferase involved in cell wall biosynthesis
MEDLLVSVIIPIYNAEKYIESMVDCLRKQTYSNVEYVFINDGSTDSSLKMLEQFTSRLKNSRIYSFSNNGAATARNHGLDLVKGDVICFLDCDDEVCENYIEKLVEPFTKDSRIDISICGYEKEFINGEKRVFQIAHKGRIINKKKAINYIFGKHHTNMIVPWAKAIKKELLTIRFPIVRCEDEAFSYQLFLKCKRISLIPDALYKYIERENSDSKNDNFAKTIDICNIYYERYKTLKEANICKHKAFYVFAYTYFCFFHKLNNSEKEELYKIYNARIKGVSKNILSPRFIKFVLLRIRYKLDLKELKQHN